MFRGDNRGQPAANSRHDQGNLLAANRLLEHCRTRAASLGAGGVDCEPMIGGNRMAKKRKRKYSRSSGKDVESEMHRYKRGTARSGRGGKGGKVKSRKQAIAIGLSKARKKGKKVPRKRSLTEQAAELRYLQDNPICRSVRRLVQGNRAAGGRFNTSLPRKRGWRNETEF
jgi:Family of unknown function (DUF6496)